MPDKLKRTTRNCLSLISFLFFFLIIQVGRLRPTNFGDKRSFPVICLSDKSGELYMHTFSLSLLLLLVGVRLQRVAV